MERRVILRRGRSRTGGRHLCERPSRLPLYAPRGRSGGKRFAGRGFDRAACGHVRAYARRPRRGARGDRRPRLQRIGRDPRQRGGRDVHRRCGAVHANSSTDLVFENCTFSGNSAVLGGALFNDGGSTIALWHSTITGNSADIGGGVGEVHFSPDLVELRNTILAGNSAAGWGPDCNLALHSDGGSLIGDLSQCEAVLTPTDLTGVPPRLGSLVPLGPNRRGFAHPLLAGSPAIDSAAAALCAAEDQRRLVRPQDGDEDGVAECDRGAIERAPELFVDGFETGATERWSATHPLRL